VKLLIHLTSLLSLWLGLSAFAQQNPNLETGFKPYGSYEDGAIDTVSLTNGNLIVHIPLWSYPQRGSVKRNITAFWTNNKHFWVFQSCNRFGICTDSWKWQFQPAWVPSDPDQIGVHWTYNGSVYLFSAYTFDGAQHQMAPANGGYETIDNAGIFYGGYPATGNSTTLNRNGHRADVVEDPNGNYVTLNNDGSITDTIGRTLGSGSVTTDYSGCNGPRSIVSAGISTFPGPSGVQRQVKYCYVSVPIQTNFQATDVNSNPIRELSTTQTMLQNIVVFNGTGWTTSPVWTLEYAGDGTGFNYGDITRITLPTGGTISYGWNNGAMCGSGLIPVSRIVVSRSVDANDGSGPKTTNYGLMNGGVVVTDPAGNDTTHTITGLGGSCSFYETSTQYFQGSRTSGTLLKTVNTDYSWQSNPFDNGGDGTTTAMDVHPIRVTTIWPIGLTSKTETDYDHNLGFYYYGQQYISYAGNPSETREYAYGQGAPGPLLRRTDHGYQAFANSSYLSANFLDLPSSKTVYDGAGNQVASTSYGYDEYGLAGSGITTQHDTSIPNPGIRGNQTSVREWLNTTGGTLQATTTYYDTGMPYQVTDPGGHTTTYSYSSSFAGAYVTQTQMPDTGSIHHIISGNYDFNTGLLTTFTDQNNQSTGYSYDTLGRILSANYPDGGQATINFNGDPVPPHITKTVLATPNPSVVSDSFYDGLGRIKRTQLTSDPEGADITDTTYDALGRVYSVTNPYRSAAPSPTDGTTYHTYDAVGRETILTRQDGNTVQTDYSAFPTVVVTDETGRKRQSTTDALGRLTQVVEPNPSTGSLTSGSYPTYYTYDALGNLTYVNQLGDGSAPRTRSFTYDSLSRLLTAYNPESGSTSYSYDADSNLISKTDARGIAASYSYDPLHRLTLKTHSDGTPPTDYTYDLAVYTCCGNSIPVSNSVGRLIHISNEVNAATTYSFDAMGRVVRQSSCIPSYCNDTGSPVNATYDLAGHLTSLIYPSGRKITEGYNAVGRLLNVNFDNFNGGYASYSYFTAYQNASGNPGYHPTGALRLSYFGNSVWNYENLNSRLQPIQQVSQASLSGNPYLVNRAFYYGESSFNNGNAGNVVSVVDGLSATRNQSYAYDWLSRITSASQTDGNFNQTFLPDPWGNLKQFGTAAFTPNFDGNNRISQTGYNYDPAGNLLSDTFHNYIYDAESRIKSVDTNGATYTYDADGNRVRKDVGSDATEYIYFNGQPIAEYKPASGDWSDYIYANGQRIAKADSFEYRIHIQGNNCSNCGWQYTVYTPNVAWLPYVVQSGDKLYFRQWQSAGARGGMMLSFADGTNSNWNTYDQDGQQLNNDNTTGVWHSRIVDISQFAGKTLGTVSVHADGYTQPGVWDIYYDKIVIVSPDGTVRPIYTSETSASASLSGTSGVTGRLFEVNHSAGSGPYPFLTTTYYHDDHLGTSRVLTSEGGWPIWQGTFLPFGQEWNPQITTNHYKFTGKERDSESMLDYFGARYYSSAMGRWMSPDWADKPEPVPYADLSDPQSLNLYGYVRNNPMSHADSDGHQNPVVEEILESPPVQAVWERLSPYVEQAVGAVTAAVAVGYAESKGWIQKGFDAIQANGGLIPISGSDPMGSPLLFHKDASPPNPYGSPGKPDHQAKVGELVEKAKDEAKPGETVESNTKVKGLDSNRKPDAHIVNAQGKTRKAFEAERHPNRQRNLNREKEYKKLKLPNETHPLDK
jgi:RHS repeat-associated protein